MAWIEQPKYEVLRSEGPFQLRVYPPLVVAEVEMSRSGDLNDGFQEIFNYISGLNQEEEKISMTSPVLNVQTEARFTTAFVMPSKYSLETLPAPRNARVHLKQRERGCFAVIRFSGGWSEAHFNTQKARLEAWIRLNGWEVISDLTLARYNPPFTPAFLRRNEVMYQVNVPL